MKTTLQYLFYPAIVLTTLWGAFVFVEKIPETYYMILPFTILVPLLIIFVGLERYMPFNKTWTINRNDFFTDLLQTFITLPFAIQLSQFLLPFWLFFPRQWLSGVVEIGYLESNYGLGWAFVIGLLLAEFCYYWMHRMSHTIPKLWKLHAVHHSSRRVYWANSGRFHIFDALLGSLAYLLPLFLLNASDKLILLILVFSGVTGFLEHVNIKFKAGVLNYVFNTAELHRWHHSEIELESNHNYGKALIVWDIVFRTFLWPKTRQIKDVGVEGQMDPVGFKNQFLFPFKQ